MLSNSKIAYHKQKKCNNSSMCVVHKIRTILSYLLYLICVEAGSKNITNAAFILW